MNAYVTIRQARRDEAGDVAALWLQLVQFHQTLDPSLPLPAHDGMEQYARFVFAQADQQNSAVFVALSPHGRIVGYVLGVITDLVPDMFQQQQAGILADLYVAPGWRRQGTGTLLADAILAWFREQGMRIVEWDVAAANVAGQAFWQAYQGRPMLIRMRKEL